MYFVKIIGGFPNYVVILSYLLAVPLNEIGQLKNSNQPESQ